MKHIKTIIAGITLLLAGCHYAPAQTVSTLSTIAGLPATVLAAAVTGQAPVIVGTPFTVDGQTFLVTTNATGGLQVYSYGVSGTNAMVVPANAQQAMEVATAWIQANVPGETNYYGTNELNIRVGAGYVQSSGQAIALVAVEKYGWFGNPNVGAGAGVLQGNNGTSTGTAGFYADLVYRHPIGNVAVNGAVVAGYDNWSSKPFGGAKIGLEYRQSAHLGEFLDYDYVYEPGSLTKGGSLITAGIEYSF